MTRPLDTSPLRMAAAGAFGYAALPVAAVASAAWLFHPFAAGDSPGPILFGLLRIVAVTLVPSAVTFAIIVAPVWLVLHKLRAGAIAAAATGAALGLACEGAIVMLLYDLGLSPEVQRGGEPLISAATAVGLCVIGSVIGAAAAYGVWRIAYPAPDLAARRPY